MSNIRKKAIARLHYMIGNIKDFASDSKHLSEDDKADLEALGMAVKSLETDEAYDLMYEELDFCEDCISRKTALMYIDIPQGGTLNDIRDAIRKMPSVLPKATKNDLPHCQHTDEEIAKSFIEDVEAVKDQLPTTKNNLGVDCISRQAAIDACHNFAIGVLDDYYEKCLKQWIIDLPSVTLQEPILDKIRAEIIAKDKNVKAVRSDSCCFFTAEEVLEIVDKCKGESETV